MEVIGLTGFKRSGKNTFAEQLKLELEQRGGYTVQLVAFADKLKIAGARALGFNRSDAELIALMDQFKEDAAIRIEYTEEGARKGVLHELTGREYLQFLGTEAGRRVFGDFFWIDQVLPSGANGQREREIMYPGVDFVVVTDVRFDNEAARIENIGGTVVEISRLGCEGDGHASEAGVSENFIDYTVFNNSTVEALRDDAGRICTKLGL